MLCHIYEHAGVGPEESLANHYTSKNV